MHEYLIGACFICHLIDSIGKLCKMKLSFSLHFFRSPCVYVVILSLSHCFFFLSPFRLSFHHNIVRCKCCFFVAFYNIPLLLLSLSFAYGTDCVSSFNISFFSSVTICQEKEKEKESFLCLRVAREKQIDDTSKVKDQTFKRKIYVQFAFYFNKQISTTCIFYMHMHIIFLIE